MPINTLACNINTIIPEGEARGSGCSDEGIAACCAWSAVWTWVWMSSRSSARGTEGGSVVSVPVVVWAAFGEVVESCWRVADMEEVVEALVVVLAERRVAAGCR